MLPHISNELLRLRCNCRRIGTPAPAVLKFLGLRVVPARKRFANRVFVPTFISLSLLHLSSQGRAERCVVYPAHRSRTLHLVEVEIFIVDATGVDGIVL